MTNKLVAGDQSEVNDLLARTRAIVETIVDGVITINKCGLIETVNPAAERIFGYKGEEIRGCNVSMLMPEPYHTEHDGYLSNYLETGEKKVIGIGREVVGLRKDGSTFPLELSVSEMEVNGERMYTGIVRDISDKNDLLARTRAIVETIVDGVITINKLGAIETMNPAAERIFGYKGEEIRGRNVSMLMPEPYHTEHDGYLRNYLETGEKKIIGIGREVVGLRKNGSTFPLELAVSKMEVNGQRMYTGIVRDISARKETETQLHEAMQRVHEQRIKDEFIATVSHELRTPLTSVRASLELILGEAVDLSSDQAVMLIKIAHKNSERLLLLINDILDISKIESEKMVLHIGSWPVLGFLEAALAENQVYAQRHDAVFQLGECSSDLMADIDPDRMMQVMTNLMSNAAKFSYENAVVDISAHRTGNGIRIVIEDRGPGIPQEFQARVFDKFTQANTTDSRQTLGGTGLGLHISKAIVEQHGGSLSFVSRKDRGSEFYVDLVDNSDVVEDGL